MTLPTLDVSGYITRTSLSLSNLTLFAPSSAPEADPTVNEFDFVQDGLDPGAVVLRRQIAESIYVDDAAQVQSSKARIPGTFAFYVTGYDGPSMQTAAATLIAAVSQPSWHIHVKVGTADWAWSCWNAEPHLGFPVETWYGVGAPLSVAVQRSPIPVAGPI